MFNYCNVVRNFCASQFHGELDITYSNWTCMASYLNTKNRTECSQTILRQTNVRWIHWLWTQTHGSYDCYMESIDSVSDWLRQEGTRLLDSQCKLLRLNTRVPVTITTSNIHILNIFGTHIERLCGDKEEPMRLERAVTSCRKKKHNEK